MRRRRRCLYTKVPKVCGKTWEVDSRYSATTREFAIGHPSCSAFHAKASKHTGQKKFREGGSKIFSFFISRPAEPRIQFAPGIFLCFFLSLEFYLTFRREGVEELERRFKGKKLRLGGNKNTFSGWRKKERADSS